MATFLSPFRSYFLRHSPKLRSTIFFKRTILSSAYACSDAWQSRKQSPILKDLDLYDFVIEIQKQSQAGNPISATDIDVLMTCVHDTEQFDEAVRLLYKFRHSHKAAEMIASTHGAFVRSCVLYGRDETLLRVLDDPINYGIFLDSHDANVLMDHFLKNGNNRDAARIASKVMLQEDFQRASTCWLAALSCLRWIKVPAPDTPPAESGQEDDDEVIFRLPFLKNPHFDDHFDIKEPHASFGKTLAWTSRHLGNKELSLNLMALGYAVKKDYAQLASVLKKMLSTRTKFYAEVEQRILSPKGDVDGEKLEEPTKEGPEDDGLEEIRTLIDQLHKGDLLIQDDLEESLTEELTKILPDLEQKDIKERTELLAHWTEMQQKRIENQVIRYLKNERLKEIENERRELKDTEDYLSFFENRTKLEISVHPELQRQEEEAERKAKAEEQQLPSDEKYVIPELRIKREEQKIEF